MEIPSENLDIRARLISECHSIASKWAISIMNTSYVPLSRDEVGNMLVELTKIAIKTIITQPFDHSMARQIGVSLVKLHYTQPEALGRTLETLTTQLMAPLSSKDQRIIMPQVAWLVGDIGTGFVSETHKKILKEQQELREAVERGKSEAENARRQMEVRNRAILHALPDAMYVMDLSGEIHDFHVNNPTTSIAPNGEILGKNLKDLLPEGLVYNFEALARKAIQTGEVQVYVGSLGASEDLRHYEFRIVPYLEGQVLTIVRDITKRVHMDAELKKYREKLEELVQERTRQLSRINERLRSEIEDRLLVEESLRESKEQLEVIVNGVADGILLMDANMRRLIINPAAMTNYGFKDIENPYYSDDILSAYQVMYENGDPVPNDQIPSRKAARGEEFPPMMLRYRQKGSQEELWSLVQASPIFDNQGQVRFVVLILHDFTEHKKAEKELLEARSELEKRVRERTVQLATTNQQLQLLTRQMINTQEHERRSIARDLHDVVLSQIGAALIMMDEDTLIEPVRSKLQSLTDQIRNIINGLRPPMLNFGLRTAIEELYDALTDQTMDGTEIRVDIQSNGARYDPEVELHLYRILQQACNNALRHAHASRLEIRGYLDPDGGKLVVIDDGKGMAPSDNINLPNSLSQKHYGLAGMFERSALIGAKLNISSEEGVGTKVELTWKTGA
jgi:PAS domain S-box-containing protein